MGFPLQAYENKKIFEGRWAPSVHVISEVDVKTGATVQSKERNVLGRFVKAGVFNPYKSTPGNWVYEERIFCQIKINNAINKDISSVRIVTGTAKAKSLTERFPEAWKQFLQECPDAVRPTTKVENVPQDTDAKEEQKGEAEDVPQDKDVPRARAQAGQKNAASLPQFDGYKNKTPNKK